MGQHDDPAWLYHMGRLFWRWSKDAETESERANCQRLSSEFRKLASGKDTR